MQGQDFAIDHHIHRSIEIEFDVGDGLCIPPADAGYACRHKVPADCGLSPSRPIGPQRTYSIRPSLISALGAIIIVPPVNLLLLKVRNRQRRCGRIPFAPSTRTGKGRRLKRARVRKIEPEVAQFSPCAEAASAQRGHIRRETHAEQIDVMNDAVAMTQAHHVAGPAAFGEQSIRSRIRRRDR